MKQQYQEVILNYLSNRLSEEEQRRFEADLAKDPDLAREMEIQKTVLAAIDHAGDMAMRQRLSEILPKYPAADTAPGQPKAKRNRLWIWILLGALLVALLFWLLPRWWAPAATPPQLYAQYYEPYDLSFGSRGEPQETQQIQTAAAYYRQQAYDQALPLFQAISQQNADGKFRMALGICQLETQQYNSALQTLKVLIELPDTVYEEHAIWYSALAYLQLGETAPAAALLQRLAQNPEAFQHRNAVQMLREKVFIEKK